MRINLHIDGDTANWIGTGQDLSEEELDGLVYEFGAEYERLVAAHWPDAEVAIDYDLNVSGCTPTDTATDDDGLEIDIAEELRKLSERAAMNIE